MTFMAAIALGVAALTALGLVLEHAPKIIAARADARLMRDHGAAAVGRWTDEEVGVALIHAVRRADPELGAELAERIAGTVAEDLERGTLEGLAR